MYPDQDYASSRGSFAFPVVPPTVDADSSPGLTLTVACAWLPYIRGALYQLLLQATWDTDAAGLALTQARVWNLIDLFVECSTSVLPFSCPYDFTAAQGDWFGFLFGGQHVPNPIGIYDAGVGWSAETYTYTPLPTENQSGVFIQLDFPECTLTDVLMTYDFSPGDFGAGSPAVNGIIVAHSGTFLSNQFVTASSDPGGTGKTIHWTGSEVADSVILQLNPDNSGTGPFPFGTGVITNCAIGGTGAPPC